MKLFLGYDYFVTDCVLLHTVFELDFVFRGATDHHDSVAFGCTRMKNTTILSS